jgi:hypothetical protein
MGEVIPFRPSSRGICHLRAIVSACAGVKRFEWIMNV